MLDWIPMTCVSFPECLLCCWSRTCLFWVRESLLDYNRSRSCLMWPAGNPHVSRWLSLYLFPAVLCFPFPTELQLHFLLFTPFSGICEELFKNSQQTGWWWRNTAWCSLCPQSSWVVYADMLFIHNVEFIRFYSVWAWSPERAAPPLCILCLQLALLYTTSLLYHTLFILNSFLILSQKTACSFLRLSIFSGICMISIFRRLNVLQRPPYK